MATYPKEVWRKVAGSMTCAIFQLHPNWFGTPAFQIIVDDRHTESSWGVWYSKGMAIDMIEKQARHLPSTREEQ